jgi:glucose-1-phosphate thymidylyltransferase
VTAVRCWHMEIAKALILVGSRPLFPVANRPILFHNLEALAAAGVGEVAILAERATSETVHEAVGDGREWGLSVDYADWSSSVGVGGALVAADGFVGEEPVLVQHGAALLRDRIDTHVEAFSRERLDTLALRLSEPARRPHVRTPGYLLSPLAVSILREDGTANPVAGVRAQGGRVRVQRVDGCLASPGDVESLLDGNRRMLEGLVPGGDTRRFDDCTIQGAVDIDPTAEIERTLLRGPVIIGPGARVSNAYIGPYTSIGAGVVIEGAEIEHSIVLPEAELRHVGTRVESSVIGRGARIVRSFELPGALRLSIGDGAEVVLR